MRFKGKIEAVSIIKDYLRVFRMTRFFGERLRNVKQYSQPGVDSSPPVGARPLVEDIGGDPSQKAAASFLDLVDKVSERGEIRIYATEDGKTVTSFVYVKKDGTIRLNGSSYGGLIQIELLTEKLNQLVSELGSKGINVSEFASSDYENANITHGGPEG